MRQNCYKGVLNWGKKKLRCVELVFLLNSERWCFKALQSPYASCSTVREAAEFRRKECFLILVSSPSKINKYMNFVVQQK